MRRRPLGQVLLAVLAVFVATRASADDRQIIVKKMVIDQARGRIKLVAKSDGVHKGSAGSAAALSGSLYVFYRNGAASGTLLMPSPWVTNSATLAKYSNTLAPAGPGPVYRATVNEKKTKLRLTARGLGGLDISTPPSAAGVKVQFTLKNGAAVHRMCALFSADVGSRILWNGDVLKMTLRNGAGAPCEDACGDGAQNATETDVDCGGNCPDCADGKMCATASDCVSGVCTGGICQVPTCSDGVKNGDETGIDCGNSCPACPDLAGCDDAADCQSGVCTSGICQVPNSTDGVKNGDETDVDCGGTNAPPCPPGSDCNVASDCDSGVCTAGTCATPTHSDGVKNGDETGVDCGGPTAPPCPVGQGCQQPSDCQEGNCLAGICVDALCGDLNQNGTETDVDCGGPSCVPCAPGKSCSANSDCTSLNCVTGTCAAPTCVDGIKNGSETDIDCGGGNCNRCADGKACKGGDDCNSFKCIALSCAPPTCSDGIKNGAETDVDCGGDAVAASLGYPACGDCSVGLDCLRNQDCTTSSCAGVCECGNQSFTFDISSNNGGSFDSAEWPGGTATQSNPPPDCSVTINRPSGNIDLVGNLGDKFSVNTFSGFSTCFGTGGEDGTGCDDNGCPPAGIGSCEANRPSCSAALNGSGAARFYVQCTD